MWRITMSFRARQKYVGAQFKSVTEYEDKILETGEMVSQAINQSEKVLPDPELFDLKNQIDAGVDMEEVNSKVFKTKKVDADTVVRKYTKRSNNVEESDN